MFDIFITVYIIFASIAIGILLLKEYQYRQEVLANIKRRKQDDCNRWLFAIGLHETSYYFNPSGIKILNGWLLFKKDLS